MKNNEVPQDNANLLEGKLREPCYALDDQGKYITIQSVGWEPKNIVIQHAWDGVNEQIEEAKQLVLQEKLSPIAYYMKKQLMDVQILAAYTGFFQWTVKRHLKMKTFNKLSDTKLIKYAEIFEIELDTLKNKELL